MAGPLKVAAQRKPVRREWRPTLMRSVSVRGMAEAIAAINGAGQSVEGDEAFAQMEQRRVETEAQRRRQGCLPLRSIE